MLDSLEHVWPEWEIEQRLGKGAYGEVYRVGRHDSSVDSYAAVKVITIPTDESEIEALKMDGLDLDNTRTYFQGIVDDFVNEIRLMESLKGVPNIVSVEDYKVIPRKDTIGWDIYIRMELLTPFKDFFNNKDFTEADVIKLGIDICSALEICAKKGVIHRDIKPENIFVNDFGNYKLGDFGIARKLENTTGGLSQKGTFNYMAPEVASGNEYDARVDIYSLGIVLYRLLNENRLPFLDSDTKLMDPAERKIAVERRLKGESLPAPVKATPQMANVILRACAFRPNNRFSDASEMKAALVAVQNGNYVPVSIIDDDETEVVSRKSVEASSNTTNSTSNTNNGVNTFGTQKKKSRLPIIIGVVGGLLLLIIVLIIAGVVVIKTLSNNNPEPASSIAEGQVTEIENNTQEAESVTDEKGEEIQNLLVRADELEQDGKIEDAISELEAGTKEYPDSEELKEALSKYQNKLLEQQRTIALEEAAEYAESGDYKKAMKRIEDAIKKYGEGEELALEYANYEELYKKGVIEKTISEAEEYAEDEDYGNAYKSVSKAIDDVGEDPTLSSKASEYETLFVSVEMAKVEEYLASNSYNAAMKVLEEAKTIVPKNEEIKNKIAEVEDSKPVSITSLDALNGGFDWNEGDPTDPFGNTYSDVSNYAVFSSYSYGDAEGYAEYRIYGNYTLLTGKISPHTDTFTDARGQIKIYADDKLKYTSPMIGRKTDSFDFSVDITDAEYIKIEYELDSYYNCYAAIILMDVNLWK